jgi:peroxiredoxin (alkyl hydroperoxide reductase subunit C)
MPEEFKPGCQRPPIKKANAETEISTTTEVSTKEAKPSMVKVGKPAPDFTAAAFGQGKFVNTSLSEYKGKWVLLCFYPGDFTFV